jgi:LCP family protein required for cell wall assembly
MRRVAIAVGLILIGVAVALFVLFSQTEVARTLRRGAPVYILVVRVDGGAQGGVRADAVAVAVLQPGGRGSWISVPRDLAWPTAAGWTSLHVLYTAEGIAGLSRRLGSLFEVALPYWVVVDFAAFRKVVDTLGGVEVTVETRLVYQDRSQNLFIDIPAGRQTLDGATALDFVRYQEGDETARLARHHQFLRAALEKARDVPTGEWRPTVEAIRDAVRTNLSLWEALDLARMLGGLSPDDVTFSVAPTLVRPGGKGELVPDLVRLRKLIQSLVQQPLLTRDEIRVLVLNGAGTKLLATRTGAWLADRGFQVTGTADADRSNYPRTYLIVRDETRAKGKALFEVLPSGVQPGVQIQTDREFDLARVGGWPKDADLILILGVGFDVRP